MNSKRYYRRIALMLSVTLVAFLLMPGTALAKTIPREKYMNDKEITEVMIGDDITSIGDRAYYGCTNLESVIISEGVKSIGESAFAMCPNLSYVSIPSTVKNIEPGVFAGDTSLSTLNFPRGNDNFYFVSGALYNPKGTRLISYLPGKSYSFYDMPDQVKYVDNYAFWGAKNLKKVYVSPKVETISPYDFAYCTGLQFIFLPESVESIQEYAFRDCKNLKYIYTEGRKIAIDETAFKNADKVQTVSGSNLDVFNANCVVDGEDEEAEQMRAEAESHQDGNKTPVNTSSGNKDGSPSVDSVSDLERARQVARNSHITSNTHPGNNFGVVDSKKTDTVSETIENNDTQSSSSSGTGGSSSTTSSSSTSASSSNSSTSSTSSTSSSSSSSSSTASSSGSTSGSSSSVSGNSSSSSTVSGNSSSSSSSARSNSSSGVPAGVTRIINNNYYDTSPDVSSQLDEYRRRLTEKLSGPYTGSYYGSLNGNSGNSGTSKKNITINLPNGY